LFLSMDLVYYNDCPIYWTLDNKSNYFFLFQRKGYKI